MTQPPSGMLASLMLGRRLPRGLWMVHTEVQVLGLLATGEAGQHFSRIPYRKSPCRSLKVRKTNVLCGGGACSCPHIPTPASHGLKACLDWLRALFSSWFCQPLTSGGHTLLSFLSLLGLSVGPRGKGWVLGPHLFQGPLRGCGTSDLL